MSVVATIFGYRLIHAYARFLSVVSGLALLWPSYGSWLSTDCQPPSWTKGNFTWAGFIGAVSVSALWQLAYAPYVSDYSRYMP